MDERDFAAVGACQRSVTHSCSGGADCGGSNFIDSEVHYNFYKNIYYVGKPGKPE